MRYPAGWDWDDEPDSYQAAIERTVRDERTQWGEHAAPGWAGPPLEMCSRHRYGLVDGRCGKCLEAAR